MSLNSFKIILTAIFSSLQITSTAQIKPKLTSGDKWETFYEKVPVSGEIRVGAMGYDGDERVVPTKFNVRIPEHNMSTLCVEISSIDGRYEARLPYDISNLKEGNYEFELPTRYASHLRNYTAKEIVILAKIGNDCESSRYFYLLSSWNKHSENPSNVFIYLNSDKPVFFRFRKLNNNEIINIECKPIKAPISVAYNCKCEIPLKDIQNVTDFYLRQRVRKINEISFVNYSFPFKF